MNSGRAAAALLLLLTASCSSPLLLRPVHVSEPMLPCRQATRAAREALVRLGYSITAIEAATPDAPGRVTATRQATDPRVGSLNALWAGRGGRGSPEEVEPPPGHSQAVTVDIHCSDAGSDFDAVTNEGVTTQLNFGNRFAAALKEAAGRGKQTRPGIDRPPTSGLVINVEPKRSSASRQDFGIDLPSAGVAPVKFEIHNRSLRRYRFRHDRVVLVTQEGGRATPLLVAAAAKMLASVGTAGEIERLLRERAIPDAEIEPGTSLVGYLYFTAAAYRRARVVLTDVDSDEPEGLLIEF